MKSYVYKVAGRNITAINYDKECTGSDLHKANRDLKEKYPFIENVGFYEEKDGVPKLQMFEEEFCGNTARSFACFLKELAPKEKSFDFYVGGGFNLVRAEVKKIGENKFFVKALFKDLKYFPERRKFSSRFISTIKFEKITYIILNEKFFPFNENSFEYEARGLRSALDIDNDKIGIIWMKKKKNRREIIPVIFDRKKDICQYKNSCGMDSFAVGLVERKKKKIDIIKPSGEIVTVEFDNGNFYVSSEVEKIDPENFVK